MPLPHGCRVVVEAHSLRPVGVLGRDDASADAVGAGAQPLFRLAAQLKPVGAFDALQPAGNIGQPRAPPLRRRAALRRRRAGGIPAQRARGADGAPDASSTRHSRSTPPLPFTLDADPATGNRIASFAAPPGDVVRELYGAGRHRASDRRSRRHRRGSARLAAGRHAAVPVSQPLLPGRSRAATRLGHLRPVAPRLWAGAGRSRLGSRERALRARRRRAARRRCSRRCATASACAAISRTR